MRLQTSASLFIAALLASAMVVGCDSTGSSEDPPPDEEGAVSFSLVRTANSDVPSDADSAFVRVWQPDGDFNLVEFVNIPDPGQQTEVSLDVPAEQGYRAGILAVKPQNDFNPSEKAIRAHGSSGQFTVESNDTSQVALDVRPAELTFERPESLTPNQTDTITATWHVNPPGVSEVIDTKQGSTPNFDYADGSFLDRVGEPETDTTVSLRSEITGPNVDSEDTTYVKVRISPNSESWTSAGRNLDWVYYPTENGASFEIPVVPEDDDDGTVIIVFSMGEDGWEKTRRVVE